MIKSIYIGKERLDLFEDENIHIRSSVSRIEDITKIFTDTSNSFTVPASDNNNRIFKHWYNATINNSFDARKKVQGLIELGGLDYKFGLFRLEKVVLKSGLPSSYTITFFGNLVSLKDLLGDDELSVLDFTDLDFDFTYANFLTKLTTSGLDVACSALTNRRYVYDSSNSIATTDTLTNVYYDGTNKNSGVQWDELKYSIKSLKILEAIEEYYDLTFSRDFFGGNEFSNLYLLMNGQGTDNLFNEQVVFDAFTGDPTLEDDRILLSSTLPFSNTEYLRISVNLDIDGSNTFASIIKSNGVEIHRENGQGRSSDGLYVYRLNQSDINFNNYDNITFHIESNSAITYQYTVDRYYTTNPFTSPYKSERDTRVLDGAVYEIKDNVPTLKCIDILKGWFKTYKLIAIANDDGSIYVDTYNNYYRKGRVWTSFEKHIDFEKVDISRGVIHNEIDYEFQEPQTILAEQFLNNNKVAYGDLELSIKDNDGKQIDGTELKYEIPFEQVVYERLIDTENTDEVNIMYGLLADTSMSPVQIKPHIHFINTVSLDSNIKIINSAGIGVSVGTLNTPSHTLGFESPVYSTVFGEEINEYNGTLITSTIFSNHHQTFIEGVFNEKKRNYKFTAKNVPKEVLHNLKLNDVLEIKEEYYRIDSYDINITTNEIVFKLINAINLDLTPIYSMSWDRIDVTWDSEEVTWDQI